jgi:hypothetical protein
VAYLHLITAGELLAGAVDVPDDQLLDDQLKGALDRVSAIPNCASPAETGATVACQLTQATADERPSLLGSHHFI